MAPIRFNDITATMRKRAHTRPDPIVVPDLPRQPRSVREAITDAVGPDDIAKATSPTTKMSLALAATGKHVYGGTVHGAVKARRRAKNKVAKASRKANR